MKFETLQWLGQSCRSQEKLVLVVSAVDEVSLNSVSININMMSKEIMMLLTVIYLVIESSHEQLECGKIPTVVNFALVGVKDRTAPWVVSMGVYEGDE